MKETETQKAIEAMLKKHIKVTTIGKESNYEWPNHKTLLEAIYAAMKEYAAKADEEKEKRVRELEEALRRARNDIIRLTDSDQPANKIHYPKYIDKVLNKKS